MKNKSKLQKVKLKKSKGQDFPGEWLYLNEKAVTVRELAAVFAEEYSITAQLWDEAGVVEIELPGDLKSMDMELTDIDFKDEYSNEYLKRHHIQTAFLVTIMPEDYEQAKQAMLKITAVLGGYFCGDTQDFLPVIK